MNKAKNVLVAIFILVSGLSLQAHEGHDHDAPKGLSAPKGGLIKALEETLVEVVAKGNDLKIYLYDKELKPVDVTTYKVTAIAQKPRIKMQDNIDLLAKETFFEATYDAKGIHRYTLVLLIKDPKNTHQDKLKFTIEPKK